MGISVLDAHPVFKIILLDGAFNVQYAFTYGGNVLLRLQNHKVDYAVYRMYPAWVTNDGVSAKDRMLLEANGLKIFIVEYIKE